MTYNNDVVLDFDYSDFDPTKPDFAEVKYPPEGKDYTFAVVGIETKLGKPDNYGNKAYLGIEVFFEVASGQHAKMQFPMFYYLANPDLDQRKYAAHGFGKVYHAITGNNPRGGLRLEDLLKELQFKTFMADLKLKAAKNDSSKLYANFLNFRPTSRAAPKANTTTAPANWGAPRN